MSEENDPIGSDPIGGYVDLFCSCHRYTEPKILSNGTDIAWPAGWTSEQAVEWRAAKGLVEPSISADGHQPRRLGAIPGYSPAK